MRKSIIIVLICCLGALLFAVVANWPEIKNSAKTRFKNKVDEYAELQKAEQLYADGDIQGALKIILEHEDALDYTNENGKRWVNLLINISGATHNAPQMISLYEGFPQAFEFNEDNSLKAADAYIISYRPKDYTDLREKWKGHEGRPQDWLVLDADVLILNNQRPEATKLLSSRSFEGPKDTGRLVRLALLSLPDNSNAAWDYLSEAFKKDPNNPDIHTYRARLLESVGKKPLALSEYIAAVQASPKNIFLMDQLAEFYLRNNEYQQAMTIWLEALKENPYEPLLVKVLFWDHVITPVKYDWKSIPIAKSELQPFILYMLDLPQHQFWDESSFNKIANGQRFLTSQQASFWLRLLQNLNDGKEKEANDLLQYNPFKASLWNNTLEVALLRILKYRKNGSLQLDKEINLSGEEPSKDKSQKNSTPIGNSFFNQLDELAQKPGEDGKTMLPEDLRTLLLSPEAFSAALLSTGWFEAALDLHKLEVLPKEFPDWVAVGITQALRANRSNEEALAFAAMQKPSEPLSLAIAELLAATKQTDKAIEKLNKLAHEPSDIGMRASWLISLLYIDRGEFQLAEKTIDAQPRLDNDILGKETKARIALLSGNEALAIQRYTAIQDKSSEAKSFLARKAFASKDWTKAKELTEELLKLYPDNALLHENLKKINEEQQAKAKTEKSQPQKDGESIAPK